MKPIGGDLKLPESLRGELKKPFGRLMECADIIRLVKAEPARVIAIGDYVSAKLVGAGVSPSLIIWDGKTRRSEAGKADTSLLRSYAPPRRVKNPAAAITKAAWGAVSDSLGGEKASILVDGEEDLLVFPAVLGSSDGTLVVYGQPGEGAILIVVNPKIKSAFRGILSRFEK